MEVVLGSRGLLLRLGVGVGGLSACLSIGGIETGAEKELVEAVSESHELEKVGGLWIWAGLGGEIQVAKKTRIWVGRYLGSCGGGR